MFSALLMILLPLKHYVLTHVLDMGYSRSRSRTARFWFVAWCCHTALEMSATAWLLRGHSLYVYCLILLTEFLALTFAWVVDHGTNYERGLKVHLSVEAGLFLLYVFLGHYISRTPVF